MDDQSERLSTRGGVIASKVVNIADKETGEAGNQNNKMMRTITSNKETSQVDGGETESLIPFSQRTSLTHAPTIYEELIQKYE